MNRAWGFHFLHMLVNTSFLFAVFLIIVTLTSARWYLSVVLICISLLICELSTCACVPGTVLTSPALSYFVFTKSCPVFPYFSNGKPKACNLELLLGSAPANWVIFSGSFWKSGWHRTKGELKGKMNFNSWHMPASLLCIIHTYIYIQTYIYTYISISTSLVSFNLHVNSTRWEF